MPSGSSAASTVDFPISESPQRQGNTGPPVVVKVPHLPFRRISLPTVPSLLHRVSVVSVASFDPFPEVPHPHPLPHQKVHVKPDGTKVSQSQSRPVSVVASPRRRNPRRDSSVKPIDDRLAAKCRKVVDEFYETEKAYVDGLELIYSHFLTPIITSLDTPEPLLNRSALTSIFSNFIDIWNLHRSFLSALTALLEPVQNDSSSANANANANAPLPKLSPLLLAHFPYLSLYTPFITAFPSTISVLNELITPPSTTRPNLQYNPRFAAFLATQESDAQCNKLKMRDWLLTIVQRCPRYLLLLKDLINSTNQEDSEHAQLTAVHTLVSKITLSLNTSLQTHAQTMSLLALQKATPNLPFQLISPGRTLLRRGGLLQAERNDDPVEREFLLFSDCMVWLAPAGEGGALGGWDWSWSGSGSGGESYTSTSASASAIGVSQSHHNTPVSKGTGIGMTRTRSKSEAELETMRTSLPFRKASTSTSRPVTPQRDVTSNNRTTAPPPPNMAKRYPSADDRWVYKGRVELVDAQIIVGSALEDERKFEVLSPEGSFVLYAVSASERDEWTTEIRGAKAQLLVSLNITNPNSTLTSSASTNHVRRALQALPYHPSDDRLATLRGSSSMDAVAGSGSAFHHTSHGKTRFSRKDKDKEKEKDKDLKDKEKEKEKEKNKTKRGFSSERRRKVEHWVPAIWIPDGKTSSCMRCGRMFGWRRRRHHCRLCGRCVCAGCSGQTFYITDANTSKPETSSKPARACDACYESVFPLIHPSENSESEEGIGLGPPLPNPSGSTQESEEAKANQEQRRDIGADTIASLSRLPSWLSMPALPVQRQPQALMDIDINSSRDLSLDVEMSGNGNEIFSSGGDDRVQDRERRARLRMKSHQKLRSYHEILEDFQEQARERAQAQAQAQVQQALEAEEDDKFDGDGYNDNDNYNYNDDDNDDERLNEEEDQDQIDVWFTPTHSLASSPVSSPRKPQRREDTARRSKRFSLPAIALHTTSVTARTADVGADVGSSGSGSGSGSGGAAPLSRESSSGVGHGSGHGGAGGGAGEPVARSRRFSLVSGGRNSYYHNYHPDTSSPTRKSGIDDSSGDLARGLAAARLSELLGRKMGIK